MSRLVAATINQVLTMYAQGYMNDLGQTLELAERLAPTVPVPGGGGQYKVFNDVNSFQIYDTARAMGGDAKRIEFDATDAFYSTKPQALEVTVDQEEREKAGPDNALTQQLLDQGKIKALLNSTTLAHAKKVVDYVLANLTAEAGIGQWSNPDIDPIDQLDQVIDLMTTDVGSTQGIKLSMDVTAWRTIRNHPKVKARVAGGAQVTPITREQLVASLVIPVDFGVYSISYNTKGLGLTVVKSRLLTSETLITYSIPNPTQYDPSAFKVFTMDRSRVTSVRTYQPASGRYDVHAVDWSEDIKQTSTLAAKRITLT